MTSIKYFTEKAFDKALKQAKFGGQSRKIVQKVSAVLGSLNDENPFAGLTTTNHGESRIPNCVKYDLGSGWRLVTVQDSRTCGFIFVGDHEDVDRFLDQQRGKKFGYNTRGELVPIPGTQAMRQHAPPKWGEHDTHQRLTERLKDDEDFVLENVPARAFRKIDTLTQYSSRNDIEAALDAITDPQRRAFVGDVLGLLCAGDEDGWKRRIAFERGEIVTDDALPDDQEITITDGDQIRSIIIGSPEYERYMALLERESPWHDWFLYLHPEQERIVSKAYTGSAQLSGVSGSGKTCVLVRRAERLATDTDAKILILTLNRSLAGLLQKLVNASASTDQAGRIEVLSFFDLAKALLISFDSQLAISLEERTWKLAEHVDEIFREYFRRWLNNNDASVLETLRKQLSARGIDAEEYLREEFDWIRSALPRDQRDQYLQMERTGRRVPITEDRRKDVLEGLGYWEKKMRDVGVVDYLSLADQLHDYIDQLRPAYSHILIDEAQDFGTTELAIARRLVSPGSDDLFLCGDIAQTVLPKHRSLTQAGIRIGNRDRIEQNYRNSREILRAAYELLVNNLDENLFEDEGLELLDPKYANFSGPAPMALAADDLAQELGFALTYARDRMGEGVSSVCVAFAGFTARDVQHFADRCGVRALSGLYDPAESDLVFSDLEQTKGYEFDTLLVVNCSEGAIPARGAPEEEAFRQGCKLYVAMTRARKELILSFNGAASPWLAAVSDTIGVGSWADYMQPDDVQPCGVPEVLPEIDRDNTEEDQLSDLKGADYLFTDHALGLTADAQDKLIELVDGRGAQDFKGKRIRWKSVGALAEDLGRNRQSDNLFGPKVSEEIRDNLARSLTEFNLYPGSRRDKLSMSRPG
ncbi:MAG: hypothetical protein DI591_08840 [Citromicrobium sp.]|nr:MAG: hypothetical protein DI591_08840 [Citromicrobium sp.]